MRKKYHYIFIDTEANRLISSKTFLRMHQKYGNVSYHSFIRKKWEKIRDTLWVKRFDNKILFKVSTDAEEINENILDFTK